MASLTLENEYMFHKYYIFNLIKLKEKKGFLNITVPHISVICWEEVQIFLNNLKLFQSPASKF